jgi:hypothetical protein
MATRLRAGVAGPYLRGTSLVAKMTYYVSVGEFDDCWEWQGARTVAGYGVVGHDGVHYSAHRVMAGALADDVVLHTCDNPPCCNPRHLRVGTQRDNIADAVAKGRMGRPAGVPNSTPRVTRKGGHG